MPIYARLRPGSLLCSDSVFSPLIADRIDHRVPHAAGSDAGVRDAGARLEVFLLRLHEGLVDGQHEGCGAHEMMLAFAESPENVRLTAQNIDDGYWLT